MEESPGQAVPPDPRAVGLAFDAVIRRRCPEHAAFARQVFERLTPERWRLEWNLPWWVGRAFGLDPIVAGDLVVSNVLGLAAIRIRDDLADGEVAARNVEAARDVSDALLEAALAPYRRRFEPGTPFWRRFDELMTAWREGTEQPDAPRSTTSTGAPLQIGAIAACLLTERADAIPAVEAIVDDAVESLVLDDHVADWEADVAAGRWNAFVASLGVPASDPASTRRAVLVALLTTDAAPRTFERIVAGYLRAAGRARALDARLTPLADALEGMASDARTRGAQVSGHYRELAERAAKLLEPAASDGRS